ncbi:hypothetical protein [Streptomyces sp. CAU 1734]|uniref:hypothetical protein n=1 Tax=Streptomyces sp. CAU 1734 TaxID=3140360 RepID=UPI00326112AF
MEPERWRGISVKWTRPGLPDLAVASALYYLLSLQPEIPGIIASTVAVISLRCLHLSRVV